MKKIILSFSALSFLFLSAINAKATTIVVQNNNDSGAGSLRQSIIDASHGDTIRFDPNLIAGGNETIVLSSQIYYSKQLVIKGLYNSTDTLFVSGGNANRIFNITNTALVTIDSMVFVNGNPASNAGGALSIAGVHHVTISNSVISNCSSTATGGAIDFRTNSSNNGTNSQNSLDMNNSTLKNNSSASYGGGLYIGGSNITLTLNNCNIFNNSAIDDGGGVFAFNFYSGSVSVDSSNINNNQAGAGGGLSTESFYSDFYTTINNSTFDSNTVSGTGGGIYSTSSETSSVIVANSTFSNNSADIAGGIYSGNSNSGNSVGIVSISNSTISDNHATNDVGGIYVAGNSADFTATNATIYGNSTATSFNKCGGVQVFGTAFGMVNSTINITSSIVWTSVGDNIKHLTVDNGGNIVSTQPIISGGYNIFNDTPNGASGTGDLTNVTVANLDLQALANNGGVTLTMQPNLGSVAINAGNPNDLSDAQNSPIIGVRDIGATERSNTPTLVKSIANNEKELIKIYPNPVQNKLFFELDNEEVLQLEIIDFSGKLILSKKDYTKKNVDVSSLSQGIYVLRISTQNGITTNRFVKQ
ncbi:MAG: T9SS type A sorting domain-containing protein [Vicingaceae bacterium]